jgi:phage gpG-like protein
VGVAIDVSTDDREVRKVLAGIRKRAKDPTPAMRIIGQILRVSIIRNFEAGGRPIPWKPSKKAKGKTLIKSGRLMKSIKAKAYPDHAELGTNVIHAAIHHFGGDIRHPARERILHFKQHKRGKHAGRTLFARESKATFGMKRKGRGYTIHMPARPYMMVQTEDWTEIKEALTDYLLKEAD